MQPHNFLRKKQVVKIQLNIVCKLFGELAGPFVLVVELSTAVIPCSTIFQVSQV